MSYLDALSLYGGDWNAYMAANSETELDYTLYVPGNPVPDYYYSDAPTDTTLSTTYTTSFGVTGTPQALSDAQGDLITYYLSATSDIAYRVSFSDVTNLTFHQNNSPDATGEIFISAGDITDTDTLGATDRPTGAYTGWSQFVGDVVLSDDGNALTPGTAAWDMTQLGTSQIGAFAILHELGHSVGLIHTSDAFSPTSIYNSQKYSIMTESAVSDHDPDMDSSVHPTGLQLLDIAVLQSMYGVNWGGVNGEGGANENTVYSHATSFTTSNAYGGFIYTIWDGAGVDVIDATGYTTPAEIDLRQGHFSSIGYQGDSAHTPVAGDTGVGTLSEYDAGNVAIAYFTVIENAIGTSGADILIGNAWNNVLFGGDGNDKIYGDGTTYDGDAGPHAENENADSSSTVYHWGPDAIAPATDLSGNDVLIGGNSDDILYGGLGNDVLDGGYNKTDIDDAMSGWDSAGEITGSNNYSGMAYSDISTATDGIDTADYSTLSLGTSHTGIDVTFSSAVDYGVVSKGASGALGTDTLLSIETVIGTSQNDTFNDSNGGYLAYNGGVGSDTYSFTVGDSGVVTIVDPGLASGIDTIALNSSLVLNFFNTEDSSGHVLFGVYAASNWNAITESWDSLLEIDFSMSTLGDGYGIEDVQVGSQIIRATDLYQWLTTTTDDYNAITASDLYSSVEGWSASGWNGGTGGTGAGGGTLPTYDGSGNVTSMAISPAAGGSPISYGIADVIDNPLVLTSFSQSVSGGTYTSSASWQTYEQAFDFVGGINSGDVRLTLGGSQGAGALTINIDSLDFSLTISNFETGQTINGIEVYNSTLHGIIQDASGATLTSTGTNTFGGSYLTLTGLGVNPSDTVTEHYYLEALNFTSGGGIDLTASITFTGSSSGDNLNGLDARADTIYGMGGDDYIYGYGGNDSIIGGAGDDHLYGGTGNDTYLFAAGWGSDTVHENTGEGTDTIRFTGIAPSDIRMYTDSSGYLHLVQISDPSNSVTVYASVTGSNNAESTIGSYVESVTFDSSYATTWDLTGGLNITGDNSGDNLMGTAYNDVITGGTGADYIYGNAGNDTIIGSTGGDYLYGGPGNDTYVFSSGFVNARVQEYTGQGTDTIHLAGIDPANVHLYTDSSGYLHIVDTTNPSDNITVNAGTTGDNNAESTIGSYVESITFDSSYATTWDLTGGLNITGDNSGDNLTGTAYNDVITGGTGADYIYGNAGDDTIVGGTGADYLYGGPGNDTYVISSGFDNTTVHENLSQGTDTIHLAGIDPADVRLYTDSSGYLHIVDTTNPSDNITVQASVTGNNNAESTVGSYVESITFDSSYATTWDLTGGLHMTGDNSGDNLMGTAYNDVITGGTGADYIYGNAGDDTIVGGTGGDYLYGGPGNDTYVISSGFDNTTIHENLSQGTDTIHLTGIDPADVRLYTDSSGYLHIVDTTNPSDNITVYAGVTGANNAESTVGSYVESVTFDSSYATTWDLTGGLNITGDNSGDNLMGTAYGDTITGGTGDDYIYGNAGNDVLYSAGGNDHLYGGPGADTFLFKGATALTGVTTIADFNTGDGDKIDLANVISTYDPLTMAIANFVQLATSGSNTTVSVDTDGSGTSYTQIATIQGVTGLSLSDLITDGNLIVHHT